MADDSWNTDVAQTRGNIRFVEFIGHQGCKFTC